MLLGTLVQTIVLLFITLRTDWPKQVSLINCLLIIVLSFVTYSINRIDLKKESSSDNLYCLLEEYMRYSIMFSTLIFSGRDCSREIE